MVVFMFTALSSFKRGARFSQVLLNWAFYCTFFLFSKHTGQPKGQNGVRLDEHGVRLEWEGRENEGRAGTLEEHCCYLQRWLIIHT